LPKHDYYEQGQLPDLAYLILAALVRPLHGYAIMEELAQMTDGTTRVGPASLYTTLKKLLDAGFITLLSDADNKKTYTLTRRGVTTLQIESEKRRRLADYGETALNLLTGDKK
jgi:DNA-binding PadR family transcriptional regulator